MMGLRVGRSGLGGDGMVDGHKKEGDRSIGPLFWFWVFVGSREDDALLRLTHPTSDVGCRMLDVGRDLGIPIKPFYAFPAIWAATSAAKSVSSTSMPSPRTKRVNRRIWMFSPRVAIC